MNHFILNILFRNILVVFSSLFIIKICWNYSRFAQSRSKDLRLTMKQLIRRKWENIKTCGIYLHTRSIQLIGGLLINVFRSVWLGYKWCSKAQISCKYMCGVYYTAACVMHTRTIQRKCLIDVSTYNDLMVIRCKCNNTTDSAFFTTCFCHLTESHASLLLSRDLLAITAY